MYKSVTTNCYYFSIASIFFEKLLLNLRNVVLVGNSGPCQRESSDKKLGGRAVDSVRAIFCSLSVVSADTGKRGLATSSAGKVPHTKYPACK